MKKSILFLATCAISIGMASPSFADSSSFTGGAMSLAGASTAAVIDVPEGAVWDGLWRSPCRATHGLAKAFGDEKGLEQNVVGAVIGIPFGVAWGIPTGALHGWRHGISSGWDKPFSTDSFVVSDEK